LGNKLGIDLGGTKIEAIVINDAFQVVERSALQQTEKKDMMQSYNVSLI